MPIDYETVKGHVAALMALGETPSRRKVRSLLGDHGSHATIGKLTDQALIELGYGQEPIPQEDAYPLPLPDEAHVAALLADLEGEAAYQDVIAHAEMLLSSHDVLFRLIPTVDAWVGQTRRQETTWQAVADLAGWAELFRQLAVGMSMLPTLVYRLKQGYQELQAIREAREEGNDADHHSDPAVASGG